MRERINNDLKAAMKAGDKSKVSTLRLIIAAIQSADIETRPATKISEAEVLGVLTKMVRQRRDSMQQFASAGRPELAAKEQAEIAIIESYLPKQLSEAEMKSAIAQSIADLGASGLKDMGKVMSTLKAKFAGQMDFAKAGVEVKKLLQ
jgi:uncharacterized protein YqeY